jgi:hypothetical protein
MRNIIIAQYSAINTTIRFAALVNERVVIEKRSFLEKYRGAGDGVDLLR